MSHVLDGSTISMTGAISVIDAAIVEAGRLDVAVVVWVVDPGGNDVAMTRMDGSPLLSRQVAADKAWTAIAFGQPTAWWADIIGANPELGALGNGNRLMPVHGGMPLVVDGTLIGGVGVSGASAEQDHQIAESGAGALTLASFTAPAMEAAIRSYFDACNRGDADAVAAHLTDDAVHYFPPGMYEGPFDGAATIGRRWAQAVAELGSVWTVDAVIADPYRGVAVAEWTHFKTTAGTVLRGDEWYRFDPSTGLISEIRAYYASPQDPSLDRLELGGFPYDDRGYPQTPPIDRTT